MTLVGDLVDAVTHDLGAEAISVTRLPGGDVAESVRIVLAWIDGARSGPGDSAHKVAFGRSLARLHGDLWAGNRLVDDDRTSWLIDPAAHGGHREFDLAMMQLFGGFAGACSDAYDEALPLGDGWRERVPLHQIAPLVVHALEFGGGYADAATAAIRRYV